LEQALNVCRTTVVQDAWRRGQQVAVHAWIYAVSDGLVRDLNFCATGEDEVAHLYASAVAALPPEVPAAR
jgi:carbonic anhydrase